MAEGYDSRSPISAYSSTKIYCLKEREMQHYDSSSTESNKGDAGIVTVGGEVAIEKTESAAYGDDRTELLEKDEGKNIKLGKTSKDPQQASELKLCFGPSRRDSDLSRKAALDSLTAATCCRYMIEDTLNALNVVKERVNEAIERAVLAEEFDEVTRYRALADKYGVALMVATERACEIKGKIEVAKNALMEAKNVASQIAAESNEASTEVEAKLSTAYDVVNNKTIAIYHAEYNALMAMKTGLQFAGLENLEIGATRSQSEERAISRNTREITTCCFSAASFILGILVLVSSLYLVNGAYNLNTISLVIMESIMVTIPMAYLIYKSCKYYKNKETLERRDRNIITRIDKRLHELEEHVES